MLIKDNRVCAYRTLTHRNIEDWRKHMPADNQGPWAVHCLEHGLRKFVSTYREAKDLASMPASCSFCEAFDQRCVYCPSSREQWSIDAMTGFTPSTGQIMGTAVCSHHKYGAIPDHIDFLENANVVLHKPVVEVFIGQAFTGTKVCAIEYQTGYGMFWIRLQTPSLFMTPVGAADYHRALGFALNVAHALNESLVHPPGDPNFVSTIYESWEERDSRVAKQHSQS